MRMDLTDLGSMIALHHVLPKQKEDTGVDVLGQVSAVLMGTHARLGRASPLYSLDEGIMRMIVGGVLSLAMREAVQAGVVRF